MLWFSEDKPVEKRVLTAEPSGDRRYLQVSFNAPVTANDVSRLITDLLREELVRLGYTLAHEVFPQIDREFVILYRGHKHTDVYELILEPFGGRTKVVGLCQVRGPGHLVEFLDAKCLGVKEYTE